MLSTSCALPISMKNLSPLQIPLREFALPSPRSGSIEPHSGYGRAAAEGQEIHARLQKKRTRLDPLYEAEVPVSCLFEKSGYLFQVSGRMDGLFRHDIPRIEEIKSTFTIRELARRLGRDPMSHPYSLQLQTYGYFYWREHHVFPALTLHLVSSRNGESEDIPVRFDRTLYEQWLELRLAELVEETRLAEKRCARRRKISSRLAFPFPDPRPGQRELMEAVDRGIRETRPMLIQAPTGLGKTVGVLYPALKDALRRGQKVVYITPKNSQHGVAEEAVTRFQQAGAPVRSLSITAKAKICFKDEPLCNPDYCEYARDYYTKLHRHGIRDLLARKRKLKARLFRQMGETYEVCPFELQFDCADEADVVICDYNYVFAPRSAVGRLATTGIGQSGKPNLVIDEAHNLPARAMDYYSPHLSTTALEAMREEILKVAPPFRREAENLLDGCIRVVTSCRTRNGANAFLIIPPVEQFVAQDAKLRTFLSRYLDSDLHIEQQDVILRLCHYWGEFAEALEFVKDSDRQEFFTTYHPHADGGTVKITCCDASPMLVDCYKAYEQVVAFSATLKPFDYYCTLSGLEAERVLCTEFQSPFPHDHRKILIIPQISTKFAHRERNYARIADAVSQIAALRSGNYFVFLPSFEFLEKVLARFHPPHGLTVLKQERKMKSSRVEEILDHLRTGTDPAIVFAVQGGSFSEGIDYAGEMVIGAFIIGPPLPNYDLEREQMKEYYQRQYGCGFDYAYTIPAMAKAVQAAGRVIRSETDRGIVVLMDSRFIEPGYSRAMPGDWFETSVMELVSGSILGDVTEFWKRALIPSAPIEPGASAAAGPPVPHHLFEEALPVP